jgi:glycerol kinase
MTFILALDQGTTSSRAVVFDHAGSVRTMAQREFKQIFPQPGWVEHDPNEIWDTQLAVAREALAKASLSARDIAAIGITNQRETTVVWDRVSGVPIHNAIVWQDRRTAGFCDELKAAGHGADIQQRTGLVLDAYFSATKIHWLLDNVAGARALAQQGRLVFGTIDTWLLWKLSDGEMHATDVSNASRTLLYNLREGAWDDTLLERFKVPRTLLPQVVRSSGVVAHTARGVFDAAIPIAGIAGDQQAALFGQRCVTPGRVKNTYGTGCFMLMHTGGDRVQSKNQLLTTCAAQAGDVPQFALEGSVFIGGAVVQWLRDGLGIINPQPRSNRSPRVSPTTAAFILCPRSRAWAARTGTRTRAATSAASHAAARRRILHAPRWRASRFKRPTCWMPCKRIRASPSPSCVSMAAPHAMIF